MSYRFANYLILVGGSVMLSACIAATGPTKLDTKEAAKSVATPAAKPAPVDKSAAAAKPAAPEMNALAAAAAKAGVKNCVKQINQVGNFLTANSQAGAHLFVSGKDANQHIFSSSLEVINQNVSSYASASFTASGEAGCDAMYESVSYWSNRCDDVATKAFGTFKRSGALKQAIISLDGGTNVRVYLMPAGTGCVSIKKEVLF